MGPDSLLLGSSRGALASEKQGKFDQAGLIPCMAKHWGSWAEDQGQVVLRGSWNMNRELASPHPWGPGPEPVASVTPARPPQTEGDENPLLAQTPVRPSMCWGAELLGVGLIHKYA